MHHDHNKDLSGCDLLHLHCAVYPSWEEMDQSDYRITARQHKQLVTSRGSPHYFIAIYKGLALKATLHYLMSWIVYKTRCSRDLFHTVSPVVCLFA